MAQNDIIDLDALLDDYEAGLLAQSAAAEAQKQQDEDIELQKLTEFGYVKPKESLYDRTDYEWSPSQFCGVTAYMKDNFSKDQARRA